MLRQGGHATEFTVLVYLSDDVTGGETVFYDGFSKRTRKEIEVARFAPKTGALLLHAHGDRCLTHEGAGVTAGVKYL